MVRPPPLLFNTQFLSLSRPAAHAGHTHCRRLARTQENAATWEPQAAAFGIDPAGVLDVEAEVEDVSRKTNKTEAASALVNIDFSTNP